MIRALAILPLALTVMTCPPSEKMTQQWAAMHQKQEAQLAQAGERWRERYEAGDWEGLRALYTDDAVLMTQGQAKIEGADNIVAFLKRLSNAGAVVAFRFENEEVVVQENFGSANLGFVTAKYRMDIAFPEADPETTIVGRSFLVYKWSADGWKLWRDIDNLAPDVKPEDFE
ncbi:YybH family protein [Erythrobacter ani]|uniref:Nuclear transport factor 2 family protein n=1 Tax=Erythrobacter ani TaxID=2827235 RepID=A0ABS6SJM3_9SPHN|nr:nuclear transport factor 2 family protein [Erythrobacter ani]MBV7265199.1 nuclear transport factor 2 family protein [Erythrobacter ani]